MRFDAPPSPGAAAAIGRRSALSATANCSASFYFRKTSTAAVGGGGDGDRQRARGDGDRQRARARANARRPVVVVAIAAAAAAITSCSKSAACRRAEPNRNAHEKVKRRSFALNASRLAAGRRRARCGRWRFAATRMCISGGARSLRRRHPPACSPSACLFEARPHTCDAAQRPRGRMRALASIKAALLASSRRSSSSAAFARLFLRFFWRSSLAKRMHAEK